MLEVLPKVRTVLEQDSSEPTLRAVLVARFLEVAECLNGRCRPDEIHRDGYDVMSAETKIEGEDGITYLQTLMFPSTPWHQGLEPPVDGSVQASFCHRGTRVISRRSLRPSAIKDETTFKLLKLQTLGRVTESDLEVRETRLGHYRRLVGAP
ncbi:hypothetical protein C6341_g25658 [Phytophthora cactorum]|nr:hypothetical protein C6341_g25658 [Phytophthora cactorum]